MAFAQQEGTQEQSSTQQTNSPGKPEILTTVAEQRNDVIEEGGLSHSADQAPIKIKLRQSTRNRRPPQRVSLHPESAEPRDAEPRGQKRKQPAQYGTHGRVIMPRKDDEANESGDNRGRSRSRRASRISQRVNHSPCLDKVTVNLDSITSQLQGSQGKATESGYITNPVAGELYLGRWQSHWYAILVLPIDDSTIPGIPLSIFETSLARRHIPVCYRYAEDRHSISGWAKDYEDGGPHVSKRRFPVLYFDDDDEVEPGAEFEVPSSQSLAWLPVHRLRSFSKYGPKGLSVRGYSTALNFYQKLEAMRLGKTPEENVPPHLREKNRGTSFDQDLYILSDDANSVLSEDLDIIHDGDETESVHNVWFPSSGEYADIGDEESRNLGRPCANVSEESPQPQQQQPPPPSDISCDAPTLQSYPRIDTQNPNRLQDQHGLDRFTDQSTVFMDLTNEDTEGGMAEESMAQVLTESDKVMEVPSNGESGSAISDIMSAPRPSPYLESLQMCKTRTARKFCVPPNLY